MWISTDATAHDVENARRDLETILNRMTAEADEAVLMRRSIRDNG